MPVPSEGIDELGILVLARDHIVIPTSWLHVGSMEGINELVVPSALDQRPCTRPPRLPMSWLHAAMDEL